MFVRLALRPLEGEQDAAPDGGRVFERFQARRERLPVVMAERGVPRAGRQHQRIEVDNRTVIEPDASRVFVDGLDGSEQCCHVPALAQELPDRPGDFRRRQRGGRDLIEKRLKQMMIAAVDEGDAGPGGERADERSRGRQIRRRSRPHDEGSPASASTSAAILSGCPRYRRRKTGAATRRPLSPMLCGLVVQATSGAREPANGGVVAPRAAMHQRFIFIINVLSHAVGPLARFLFPICRTCAMVPLFSKKPRDAAGSQAGGPSDGSWTRFAERASSPGRSGTKRSRSNLAASR